jgi:hypothetical protein
MTGTGKFGVIREIPGATLLHITNPAETAPDM